MRGSSRWVLLATLLLLVGSAAAQELDTGPSVEVEDAEIPGLVVPLDAPGKTTVTVRVGCEAQEVPNTDTLVDLAPASAPDWMNVLVSPSRLTWTTGPGDCPSTGMPFEDTVQVSVSTTQDAPGYQEEVFALEAEVLKVSPTEADERGYGPYTGNVSLTPGYFHLHNVRVDEKIQQTDPGQRATFEGEITSSSNHETAFTLTAVGEPEGFTVTYDPSRLVLAPNETGTFTVEVGPENGSHASRGTVSVQTQIHGESTHELGGETATSRVSVLAKFQADRSDPRDGLPVPGAGALVLAAIAAAAVLAVNRRDGG